MNDRNDQILRAAWELFARYGLSKTTMADIAREAGVARQTLYNAYDGKDDVFRAVVRLGAAENIRQVREAWAGLKTLPEKIDAFYRLGPIEWYEMLQRSPDASGLLEGFNEIASSELQQSQAEWVALFAELLAPYAGQIAQHGQTVEELADFFYASAKSAKYEMPSRALYLRRLDALKAALLALVR